MDIRTGTGFDVHGLVKGRDLVLGGIKIPHEFGLQGHSDADVLFHALSDAILGAAGLGDIGEHFPDTNASLKGLDSSVIVKKSLDMITAKGFAVSNASIIVIAQKPKLSPYKKLIQDNVASVLNIETDRINISATTTEKLGFTGREEGIASICSVLLIKQM